MSVAVMSKHDWILQIRLIFTLTMTTIISIPLKPLGQWHSDGSLFTSAQTFLYLSSVSILSCVF